MKYERSEHKDFDEWFFSLPREEQDRWRKKGVLPYAEVAVVGNVFPVIPDHPAWNDSAVNVISNTALPGEDQEESVSYISDRELRLRLINLFQILDRFADGRMHLHLIFIRTMLGEDTGTNLAQLCRRFRITKQAMFWRARQMRQALGSIAKGKMTWSTSRRRSGRVRASKTSAKGRKQGKRGAARNLFDPPPHTRVAARPGDFLDKTHKKTKGLSK